MLRLRINRDHREIVLRCSDKARSTQCSRSHTRCIGRQLEVTLCIKLLIVPQLLCTCCMHQLMMDHTSLDRDAAGVAVEYAVMEPKLNERYRQARLRYC